MSASRRIMAFDLATRTGWASYHPIMVNGQVVNHVRRSGIAQFGRDKTLEHPGVVWFRARTFFRSALVTQGLRTCDVVYFEEPQTFKNRAATEMAYGLKTVLEETCCDLGLPMHRVNPSTLKKHATGDGRAKKDKVVAAARERLAWNGTDDNEADALWVLDIARLQEEGTWVPHSKRRTRKKG